MLICTMLWAQLQPCSIFLQRYVICRYLFDVKNFGSMTDRNCHSVSSNCNRLISGEGRLKN